MPKTRKKTVARSSAIDNSISAALESLTTASINGQKAIETRTKENKKLTAIIKRLSKRRKTLMKRKKSAAIKAKSEPSATSRKDLRTAVKELAAVTKEAAKARTQKGPLVEELAALKFGQRNATAYVRAIDAANKQLSKPKKKKKKKRAKKTADAATPSANSPESAS